MEICVRQARAEEAARVTEFYYAFMDRMDELDFDLKWSREVYPTGEYIGEAARAGELYLAFCGAELEGAMVVNHAQPEAYARGDWLVPAAPEQVTVIHTLCVRPEHTRRGIAREMVRAVIRLAEQAGQRAIRLDAIEGNLPAEALYQSLGFRYARQIRMWHRATGWCNFSLYEYPIG